MRGFLRISHPCSCRPDAILIVFLFGDPAADILAPPPILVTPHQKNKGKVTTMDFIPNGAGMY